MDGGFHEKPRPGAAPDVQPRLVSPWLDAAHYVGLQSPQHGRHASASASATLAVFLFVRAVLMTAPPPLPYTKPALTFEQQLARLQSRGLAVSSSGTAIAALASISYYRLSGYWYPLRMRADGGELLSEFRSGATLDDVLGLYDFDRRLRLLVLDALERVEVALRAAVTYHLGHQYGAFGHESAANFHPRFEHAAWLVRLHEEVARSQDAFVTHYRRNYEGFPTLPIWMVTEVMSLGSLSRLVRGLKSDDKRAVAGRFQLHPKRLEDWLHVLTYVRNVCAHHSRLWNRELAIRPDVKGGAEWLPPVTPRNDRIFYTLLMLRHLQMCSGNGDEWAMACEALLVPMTSSDRWRIAMGFPEDWTSHPVWAGAAP